ncbi:Receptor tyrosine-protein kinase [Trichinella spiralis]|uniref:Receptor tyrosine-protein kinase n=1 Tax=Trichinella spiralis TaxID=6334 RepID=A0ABR3K313_TRISP
MLSVKVGVLAVGLPVCPKGASFTSGRPAVFVPHFAFAKFNAHRIQALVVVVVGRCGAYSLFSPLVSHIFAIAIRSSLGQISATAFDTEEACRDKCFGERDNGCLRIQPLGQWICRCQSGYYSRRLSCERECENNMYWSLFTTGECVEADTSFTGSCQLTCAFRLRIWTTVFIIILFASAVVLLIFIIPICASSFRACLMVKKQKKMAEEDVAAEMASREMAQSKAIAQAAWSYPYAYWPYYSNMRN